jgi:prophage DNA circulation protein
MPTFLDNLLKGSVEGLPIHVDGSDMPIGQRIIVRARPFSDKYWVDELGREVPVIRVQAFILDNDGDLKAQRDKLIEALNKPGNKTLVHPKLGTLETKIKGRWSSHGALEKFTLMCFPPHAEPEAAPRPQTDKVIAKVTGDARETLADKVMNLALKGHNLVKQAVSVVNQGMDSLTAINGRVNALTAPISDAARAINAFSDEVTELIQQPQQFVSKVAGVYRAIYGGVNSASNAYLSPGDIAKSASGQHAKIRVKQAIASFRQIDADLQAIAPVVGKTPTRAQERANQDKLIQTMRTTALLELCDMVAQESRAIAVPDNQLSPFDSVVEANAVREELVAALSAHAEAQGDVVFNRLRAVSNAVLQHFESHGQHLPRVETARFHSDLPAVVIAHLVHGDASSIDDLVRRNNIRNPLRIPGGTSLEVLRNE